MPGGVPASPVEANVLLTCEIKYDKRDRKQEAIECTWSSGDYLILAIPGEVSSHLR